MLLPLKILVNVHIYQKWLKVKLCKFMETPSQVLFGNFTKVFIIDILLKTSVPRKTSEINRFSSI